MACPICQSESGHAFSLPGDHPRCRIPVDPYWVCMSCGNIYSKTHENATPVCPPEVKALVEAVAEYIAPPPGEEVQGQDHRTWTALVEALRDARKLYNL